MSGQIFDTTVWANALKIKYGPNLVSQLNDETPTLNMFETDSESWMGSQVQFPIHYGRYPSAMAMGALGYLPAAGNITTASVIIPTKWVRTRVLFDIEVMYASATNAGAWARGQDFLMDRAVTDLADEINRMVAGGTGRGILALVDDTDGSSSGVLGVDAPGGIAADGYGSRYLQPNMIVAFVNPSDSSIRSVRTLSAVTNSGTAATITLDNDVNTSQAANNDWIVRVSNSGISGTAGASSSLDNEVMGIPGIVDDGTLVATFHNVVRSSVTAWQSTVLSTNKIGLMPLQELEDTIHQRSGKKPTHHFMHHSVKRGYLAVADATRTFTSAGGTMAGIDIGQEPEGVSLAYNGKPFLVDRDAPLGRWYMLHRPAITHYVLTEGEWAEETGSMLRAVPGQDAFEAIYRKSGNLSSEMPNSMGVLTGLSTNNAILAHIE